MSQETNKGSEKALQPKNYVVPVQLNDLSIFDGAFTFMKERFTDEMRRIEDEMALFSKNLLNFSNETKSYRAGVVPDRESNSTWENIVNSPLVEGEGENKSLRLQFDVSQFEPGEVVVKIISNTLVVSAQHLEKTDGSEIHNQYQREFMLPAGVDLDEVRSTLSKDGVLTVRAPLNLNGLVGEDGSQTN